MIYEDLRASIIADPTLSAIVSGRVYAKKPNQAKSGSYIQINREARSRDIVTDGSRMRFTCFSKDILELENMANGLISLFEGAKVLNGQEYYQVAFINQVDIDEKVENGMFFSYLDFIFNVC